MKKLIRSKTPMIAVLITAVLASLCLGGCYPAEMGNAIENAEVLVPPDDVVAAHYSSIYAEKYNKLWNALDKMSANPDVFDIERIFCIEGSKCWFAGRRYHKDGSKLQIMSIGTNGKGKEIIGEFETEFDSNMDRYFGEAEHLQYWGKDVDYSRLEAFYSNGKIVVNSHGSVTEFNVHTGEKRVFEAESYAFPQIETRLRIEDGDMLIVERGEERYSFTLAKMLETSPEMSFLYELTKQQGYSGLEKHRFLYSVVYYNAEPYFVVNPISNGGESFGALFKYEPDSRSFKYINCVYTSVQPHDVYPVAVN